MGTEGGRPREETPPLAVKEKKARLEKNSFLKKKDILPLCSGEGRYQVPIEGKRGVG